MSLFARVYKYPSKFYLIKCKGIDCPHSCDSTSLPHRAYTKLRTDILIYSY